jgi:D-serine deaminase-like pyridoxal phosphate-dependent protein
MSYDQYRQTFLGQSLPLAYVDLALFDQNIRQTLARAGGKPIRIASKSVRCPHLLRYLLDSSPQFQGLMCYTLSEALWLSEQGFDDLLVAYPCTDAAQVRQLCQALAQGKKIYLMADLPEHLRWLEQLGQAEGQVIPVCLDLDLSSRFPFLHFGVQRSSIRDLASLNRSLAALQACPHLRLVGCMGYEAQIAGLGNAAPGKGLMNLIISFLQKRSIPELRHKRRTWVARIRELFPDIFLVNGGGTGSLESTREEDCVTELTAGSAFYAPTLFDAYRQFKPQPAAGFALPISRQPMPHIYTCLGGGYVASGAVGLEKVPKPYLPQGSTLLANEMAGEVQTPVQYQGQVKLQLGDPIFFRHSKAGELCEHFNELYLIRDGVILDKVKTYRGFGQCFLG